MFGPQSFTFSKPFATTSKDVTAPKPAPCRSVYRDLPAAVRKAYIFNSEAFLGQTRDNSTQPKREHSNRVMYMVEKILWEAGVGESERNFAMQVAVLHDVIEDTDVTYEQLVREFGTKVADSIRRLSIPKDRNSLLIIFKAARGEMLANTPLPSDADLKHSWKDFMAKNLLRAFEPAIKAVDNIDKLVSDARDFTDGNLKLNSKQFPDFASVRKKNERRRHYHELYIQQLQKPVAIEFFGRKVGSEIVRLLNERFEQSVIDMEGAARCCRPAPKNRSPRPNRVADAA